MEKEMIEMFIYYVLALTEDGTKDYCIKGIAKKMDNALYTIQEESFDKWNDWINSFKENHPVFRKQKELSVLTIEQFIDTLKKAKKMVEKYSYCGTLNYDSLYLLESEKDVENLAYQIILKSKTTEEIKQVIEEKSKKENADKQELAILIDELCIRYCYGIDSEKDYEEAIKGWNMISDYSKDAKYSLAMCYKKGRAVKEDKEKAYNLFTEIMKDDMRAKYEVARMLFAGEGIKQDYEKAFKIFNELKNNVPYDLKFIIDSYLGEMYFYGLGVEKDKDKGFELFENAWNSGFVKLNYKTIKKILIEYYNINK